MLSSIAIKNNPYYAEDRFFLDIEGDKPNKVTYEGRLSEDKIVNDIKTYFRTGEIPKQSELAKFRYSLKINTNVINRENKKF